MENEKEYTLQEVAQLSGLSERTIRRYLKSGKVKAQLIKGVYRFTQVECEKLFKKGETKPAKQVQVGTTQDETLKNRIKELEQDKAFLQKTIFDLQISLNKAQETIVILTQRALPEPKPNHFYNRIMSLFNKTTGKKSQPSG